MAIFDFVTSAIKKIRLGDVLNNRPNSEALMSLMAANINFLIDKGFYDEDFAFDGYFNANAYDNGVGGIKRVQFDSQILEYQFALRFTGTSGNNIINAEIRDADGALVGNLFGAGGDRLLIAGGNRTNVVVGKDVVNNNNFQSNLGAVGVQYGLLNFTTLQAGWMIIPFVEGNGAGARNANLKLRLRGI